MTIRPQRWLLALLTSLFFTAAQAEPQLNGVATYTKLGQDQFLAGLYLPSPTTDVGVAMSSGGERRLELRITADNISARSLNRVWIEGMAINIAADTLQKNADGMVAFTNLLKGRLYQGDVLVVDDLPGEGIRVTLNETELERIRRAPDLFNMLLSTWIGTVPLSSDFRAQIMASGNINADLLARYRSTEPTTERIAAAKSLKSPPPKPVEVAAAAPVAAAAAAAAPVVAAPTVKAPSLATAPKVEKPKPEAKPVVEPPKVAKAEPKPAPKPKPTPVNNAFLDDEELEEEEEPLLTAASLVSRQLYHSKLLRWTYKNIKYPHRALQRGQEGSVRIAVVIDRNGKVLNSQAIEESQHSLLNAEAMKAVERSDPFPPMPAEVQGEKFEFTLPITFAIPKG